MLKSSLVAITLLAILSLGTSAYAACNNNSGYWDAGFVFLDVTNPAINIDRFLEFQTAARTANAGSANGIETITIYGDTIVCEAGDNPNGVNTRVPIQILGVEDPD